MELGETLCPLSRDEWRGWLGDHHTHVQEVWLLFYTKGSGKPSISYDEAVEEAICYGWIDSQIKSLDQERFVRRFTPRREDSHWSGPNRRRALKMLRRGRMTEAGRVLLPDEVLRAWQADA